MARTTTPKHGHNSGQPLTDEEFDDLKSWFARQIRAQQRVYDQKKAEADGERDKVNSLFKRMTADLKYTRQDFQEYMTDLARPRTEFRVREEKRRRLYANSGLDTQFELDLGAVADTVTDQADAEQDGRRAYLAFEDPIPPDHVSPILHPDWMRGWQDEQAKSAEKMARAEAFLAKREEPNAEAGAVDLSEDEDEGAPGSRVLSVDEVFAAAEPETEQLVEPEAEAAETPSVPDHAEVKRQAEALEASGFTATARRQRLRRKAA